MKKMKYILLITMLSAGFCFTAKAQEKGIYASQKAVKVKKHYKIGKDRASHLVISGYNKKNKKIWSHKAKAKEEYQVYLATYKKRKNKVYMVEKPIADAVSLGLPINHTSGSMIVNIGAQSTEISIIEKGRVVISKMVEVGGKQLNEAIISMVRRNCNLNIGERSAARLKLSLSYLKDDPQEVRKVVGVDWITGLPQVGVVTSDMVNEAIEEPFLKICEEIRFFLDRIPPQIYSNIADEGVFLIGGTTKIPGVGWFISQEVRIRVRLSKYHDLCTIYGIKEIIGNKTLWKWVK